MLHRVNLLTCSMAVTGLLSYGIFASPQIFAMTPEEMAQRIEALETQNAQRIKALEEQNAELRAKVDKLESAQQQQKTQTQTASRSTLNNNTTAAGWAASTTLSSYGEMGYSHPTQAASQTNVDLARAVIGISHRFNDSTKMVGEWEWEHAVTSSSDSGESEVEQLYVDHEFNNGIHSKAGLFLMPVGLINQNHEPTAYYGVFRPDVDTKIVPSTWREVGLGISGTTNFDLSWDAGLTTGPNLSKWDPSTTEGKDRGPLAAIHGEGQFAAARNLSIYGALNWRGVPGLSVGSSVFAGSIGQKQPGFLGNDSKLLLLDVHARYQYKDWDFAGEYVRGTISNTEALNTSFSASSTANPTLVPALFYGGYVQAAYKAWHRNDYTLTPFVRYEILNTAAGYGSLPASAGGIAQPDEKIWTIGANFQVSEGVVLKADYRQYHVNSLPSATPPSFNRGNSVNLGVGYSF